MTTRRATTCWACSTTSASAGRSWSGTRWGTGRLWRGAGPSGARAGTRHVGYPVQFRHRRSGGVVRADGRQDPAGFEVLDHLYAPEFEKRHPHLFYLYNALNRLI